MRGRSVSIRQKQAYKAVTYYSEHQIVYMACQQARGLWGPSEVTGGL
jgi:hypothetical protein